jgi:acyl-[acyl-carrier-protein]-phospholipid O-acyltransferase/long-chain-fatty-acid--[acyl-carrier-protein] ligase
VGIGVAYHPSPLDLVAVSKMIRDYGVTFLPATPPILEEYTRGCSPEDFGSLEFIAAGIERLPKQLALALEGRFGIRPLESYGAAERSALVAVNTLDVRPPRPQEAAPKRGPIGPPLPGASIRIVDPETRQPLPVGTRACCLFAGRPS